ncbi:hypothetical protein VST63_19180 [Mycolicibacterium sp. 050232]|uniref:hypothetical protein n=1 Tax=Mycolicibacterium sp. 050232 TaxID=3113982 RepID=UPI002E29C397|nr:hypothetical protein [Mycolicibacterium sp. 050232]MED5814485.1 hypothetical protein [Mycolicibacterium sp. 050232]
MTPKRTAGQKLRATLERALTAAANQNGYAALEFTELEERIVEKAVEMADWVEHLKTVRDAELRSKTRRPSTLTGLSAEVRHCEDTITELIGRLHFGLDAPAQQRPRRVRRGRPGTA